MRNAYCRRLQSRRHADRHRIRRWTRPRVGCTQRKRTRHPQRPTIDVTLVAFSPDGNRIFTASWDNTAQSGIRPAEKNSQRWRRWQAAWMLWPSSRSTRIVTVNQQEKPRESGKSPAAKNSPPARTRTPVNAAAFSPDGSRMVTASIDSTADTDIASRSSHPARTSRPAAHSRVQCRRNAHSHDIH